MGFEVRGLTEAKKKLKSLTQNAPKKFARGMLAWGEKVMTISRERCPKDTGELSSTGAIETNETKRGLSMRFVYGTEYAVPQHERLDYEHADGEAKYLENPMFEEAGNLEPMMAKFGKITEGDL